MSILWQGVHPDAQLPQTRSKETLAKGSQIDLESKTLGSFFLGGGEEGGHIRNGTSIIDLIIPVKF